MKHHPETNNTTSCKNIYSNYFTLVHINMFFSQAPQNSYGLYTINFCLRTRTLK